MSGGNPGLTQLFKDHDSYGSCVTGIVCCAACHSKASFYMNTPKYDIAVAYRIYPRVSKNPAMFPEDKLRLARLCLRSFRASLVSVRAKIFVLLDGCPSEFDAIFTESFDKTDLELIRLNGEGNRQTFLRQIEILLKQDCADGCLLLPKTIIFICRVNLSLC